MTRASRSSRCSAVAVTDDAGTAASSLGSFLATHDEDDDDGALALVPRAPGSHADGTGDDVTPSQDFLGPDDPHGLTRRRLDTLDRDEVELLLRSTYLPGQEGVTVLESLQTPADGLSGAEAARRLLDSVGDWLEESSKLVTCIWRYVELERLWSTHANAALRSGQAFFNSLDNRDQVRAGVILATSADFAKAGALRVVNEIWGHAWWEAVPPAMRPSLPTGRVTDMSKRMLEAIAATCKAGIKLDEAIEGWKAMIYSRTDEGSRRRLKLRSPTKPELLHSDVYAFVTSRVPDGDGKRTMQRFFPGATQERVGLTVVRAAGSLRAGGSPAKRGAVAGKTGPVKRRMRVLDADGKVVRPPDVDGEDQNGGGQHADGDSEDQEGTTDLDKLAAVEGVDDRPDTPPSTEDEGLVESLRASIQGRDCHGQRLAMLTRAMLRVTAELVLDGECCVTCRFAAQDVRRTLLTRLGPQVYDLESKRVRCG